MRVYADYRINKNRIVYRINIVNNMHRICRVYKNHIVYNSYRINKDLKVYRINIVNRVYTVHNDCKSAYNSQGYVNYRVNKDNEISTVHNDCESSYN